MAVCSLVTCGFCYVIHQQIRGLLIICYLKHLVEIGQPVVLSNAYLQTIKAGTALP